MQHSPVKPKINLWRAVVDCYTTCCSRTACTSTSQRQHKHVSFSYDVSDGFAAYLVVTWPPTWLLLWCSRGLTTATRCLLDYLISQSHHYQRVVNVAVRLVNGLRPYDHVTQAAIDTGYRQKHVLSISFAYWYTTLLPAGHLHISLIFFNPSPPCRIVIQVCDLQLPTVYTCHAPDCCLASEPSESPLPRCGINSHTPSALPKILTLWI